MYYYNNAFFQSVPGNFTRGLKYGPSLQSRCDDQGQYSRYRWKNSYYCIYSKDILKTYQRENKLFEFSRYTNREKLRKRKNDLTLQQLRCSGFLFSCSAMFTNKAPIFFGDGPLRKISARRQGLLY